LREEIERLMRLQSLDRGLQDLEESLSAITGRVNQLREQTAAQEIELETLSHEDQEAAAARKKLERELAEGETGLRNKRMRRNLVRNDKELQALGHEVELLKENNQRVEADLLTMMEGSELRATRLKELSEALAKARAELAAEEKEVAGQVEQIKSDISKRRRERAKVAADVNPALLQRYEMIFPRRQGVVVALAKAGTCLGCMRLLPPQLYNEIQKHLQIHFCPSCQRILYFDG
jgi:uncharacterized protein